MSALVIIEGLTMYLSEADVRRIFDVIAARLPKAEVFVETMNPAVAKRFKERSIEGSHAKFTWGVKDGRTLAALLPGFRFVEEHSLTEGMAVFAPIYKLLDKLPAVRNISNKIIVLEPIHSYVEQKARRQKKLFLRLMCIPGLYKKVPGIFSEQTPKLFGVTAGFAARDIQTTGGVWRIDMTKCPYHDASVYYGCPELCHCFCDSDDITYDGLHPKLYWHRTKTLGRGGDCCDFCLKLRDK